MLPKRLLFACYLSSSLVCVLQVTAATPPSYQPPNELENLLVSDVDATLPSVTFENWLKALVDSDYAIYWRQNPCGRFQGVELAASRINSRVCLIANYSKPFGREIEILFELVETHPKNQIKWRARRIRFYSQLRPITWVELQKLSQLPPTLAADRDFRYAEGGAWQNLVEDRERSRKLGSQFLRCILNPSGTTKLMRAARDGDLVTVERLLKKGVDVNERSIGCGRNWHEAPMRDKTALMFAAENGHARIVKKLIDAGADITLRTNKSDTAWSSATDGGHLEVLKILWLGANKSIPQQWLINSLHRISTRQEPQLVEFLAERITNSAHLSNALSGAAMIGDETSVQILLDHGAWVTGQAIAAAAYHGGGNGAEALGLLLEQVDTPELRWMASGVGKNYVTPLMVVVENVRTHWGRRAVDVLIAHGADINAIDAKGRSVLDYAISGGDKVVIQNLKIKGAKKGEELLREMGLATMN